MSMKLMPRRARRLIVEPLETRTMFSESASAQLALVSTSGTMSSPVYHYAITVTDTGTTNIGTFWFAWIPGEDFLPSAPLTKASPTGWASALTGSANSSDGSAIQWIASSNAMTPGQVLGGFDFTSSDSPSALAGNSPTHSSNTVMKSVVYSGAPFSDGGFTFNVAPIPAATAPTLASTQVGNGSAQRSAVSNITVVFSEKVNVSAASFTLQETQDETAGFTWSTVTSGVTFANPSGDGMTWVISVIGGGSLDRTGSGKKGLFSDGIYQLLLNGSAITDASTGTAEFNGGGTQVATFKTGAGTVKNAFSVLFGDMEGTGQVDNVDYDQFKDAYGASAGHPAYNAALDYDGNGIINAIDYGRFKLNYGKSYSFT